MSHSWSQVFDRSDESAEGRELIRWGCQVNFLDEFRILLAYPHSYPCYELLVFNTLTSQDDPRNLRRFKFPQKYYGRGISLHLDCDRTLGTVNRDGPLIVDPSQAILIVGISSTHGGPGILFVLRTQTLIDYACSMRADVQIPWDDWGKGSVTMENLIEPYDCIAIHGARMLVIRRTHWEDERPRVYVFDLGRRGRTRLSLPDGNSSGAKGRVMVKDGRSCALEAADRKCWWGPRSLTLGDSVGSYVVSPLSYPAAKSDMD